MNIDRNSLLTHVYGVASLIPAIVSIIYLVKTEAPWQEYALVGSGWFVAMLYALMLEREHRRARTDGEKIGRLEGEVRDLTLQIARKEELVHFFLNRQAEHSQPAKPRSTPRRTAKQGIQP